jgi:hypothetical protein
MRKPQDAHPGTNDPRNEIQDETCSSGYYTGELSGHIALVTATHIVPPDPTTPKELQ